MHFEFVDSCRSTVQNSIIVSVSAMRMSSIRNVNPEKEISVSLINSSPRRR